MRLGFLYLVALATLSVAAPTSFDLLLPADNTILSPPVSLALPTLFQWTAPSFAPLTCSRYTLMYGARLPPSDVAVAVTNCALNVTVSMPSGAWFWNVIAIDSRNGQSVSSRTQSICIQRAPSSVNLFSPAPSTSTADSQPTLSWSNVDFGLGCSSLPNVFMLYWTAQSGTLPSDLSTLAGVNAIPLASNVFEYTFPTALSGAGPFSWQVIASNGQLRSLSSVWSFTICTATFPTAPVVSSPTTGQVVSDTISFAWSASNFGPACGPAPPRYLVQLSRDSDVLSNVEVSAIASTNSYSLTSALPAAGAWFVVVSAINGAGQQTNSVPATFEFCVAAAPAAPALLSPSNAAVDVDASVSVHLQWAPPSTWGVSCVPATRSYRVVVTHVQSNTQTVYTPALDVNAVDVPRSIFVNGDQFTWQVTALDGTLSAASAVYSFVPCVPTQASAPALLSPADGASFATDTDIAFSWNGAAVTLGNTCPAGSAAQPLLEWILYFYPSAGSAIEVARTNQTSLTFRPPTALAASSSHFWRVARSVNGVPGAMTAARSLLIDCTSAPPSGNAASALVAPAGGATTGSTTVVFQFAGSPSAGWGPHCSGSGSRQYTLRYGPSVGALSSMVIPATGLTTVSQSVAGLTPGENYWQVAYTNEDGQTFETIISQFTVPGAGACVPSAPLPPALVLVASAATTESLTWAHTSFGSACGSALTNTYTVYVDLGSGDPTSVRGVTTNNRFDLSTLPSAFAGQSVSWKVQASNGATSATSAVSPLCLLGAPSAPTIVGPVDGALPAPSDTVQLSWTAPSSWGDACLAGSRQFRVYADEVSPAGRLVASLGVGVTSTSLPLWSSPSNTPIYWRVEAVTSSGLKTSTAEVSFTLCSPDTPLLPLLTGPDDGAVNVGSTPTLTWSAAPSFQTCDLATTKLYRIYLSQTTPPSFFASVAAPTLSFTPSSPLADGVWYWAIDTDNGLAASDAQTAISSFTVCSTASPAAPLLTPANGASVLPGSALNWDVSSFGSECGAVSRNIQIFLSSGSTASPALVANLSSSVSSFSPVSPLTAGTYSFKVVASNGVSPATASSVSVFTVCTPTAPSAPSLVSPVSGTVANSPSIRLTWTAASFGACRVHSARYALFLGQGTTPGFYGYIDVPNSNLGLNTFSLTTPLEAGTWRWSLVALDGSLSSASSAIGTFSVCGTAVPSNPTVLSPQRGAYVEASNIGISWDNAVNFGTPCGACPSGQSDNFEILMDSIDPPTSVVGSFSAAAPGAYNASVVNPGIYWLLIRANSCFGRQAYSLKSVFAVCKNAPPDAPTGLYPDSGPATVGLPTAPTLSWAPIDAFGTVCFGGVVPVVNLYVDTVNPPVRLAAVLLSSATSAVVPDLDDGGAVYYWRVESDNGLMKVSSGVLSFTTVASGCPSLNCANAFCNQTLLNPSCECLTGWTGSTCATAICASSCGQHGVCSAPNQCTCSPGFSGPTCAIKTASGSGSDPLLGGIVAAVVIILLLIAGIYYLRKYRAQARSYKSLKMPDYAPLAYSAPKSKFRCDPSAEPWKALKQMLIPGASSASASDFVLALALGDVTPVTELDEIAKALVYVFEDATCNVAFQRYLIDYEVRIAEHESTLFRANGLTSKVFKFYSKIVGLPYLFRTLALLLNEIVDVAQSEEQKKMRETNEGKGARGSSVQLLEIDTRAENLFSGDMEIDPSKMKGDQDAFTNMLALQLVCQKILVQIRRSVPRMPRPFLEIFAHLKKTIEGKFPGAVHSAVGGFIFLRFVNPAILLPESYGLTPQPPNETARRQLVLVTKVIQNLSNQQEFGKKEEFMVAMNPFIQQNISSVNEFLDAISVVRPPGDDPAEVDPVMVVPNEIMPTSLALLYGQLKQSQAKVEKRVTELTDPATADAINQKLRRVLASLESVATPIEK